MSECHYRTASDGTVVRVRGDISQEDLDALAAVAKAIHERQCKHEGPHPMPEIAQRIHGRVNYTCSLDKGHEGPHRHYKFEWANR